MKHAINASALSQRHSARALTLVACLLASPALAAPSPEPPVPALVLGCGVHIPGPFVARDADTGVVLLAVPDRQALDTDCAVSDAPLVFDGPSHRAIVTHH